MADRVTLPLPAGDPFHALGERPGADGERWRDRNRGGWATALPHLVAASGRAGGD